MPYPGYLLNPGDMFQVDMDRVLFATGAPKPLHQVRTGRKLRRALRRRAKDTKPNRVGKNSQKDLLRQQNKEAQEKAQSGEAETASSGWQDIEVVRAQRKEDFSQLLSQLEALFDNKRTRPGAKRKIELRKLRKDILNAMRNVNRKTAKSLDDELNSLLARFKLDPSEQEQAEAEEEAAKSKEPSKEQIQALREAMERERENPVDESKPYATPWRPRPYMSAFAFIPRYLEVNHKICSAVYLRHPVARPRLAEVPSPFPTDVQQLAFNWYLRRR